MIVAVEGIDGSGKTTLALQLREVLNEAGGAWELVHFPSKRAARWLWKLKDVTARSMTYAADFWENRPSGDVILDRYVGSHYAYSPGVRGLDGMVAGLPVPDCTILCDTDLRTCLDRRPAESPGDARVWLNRFDEFYRHDSRCARLGEVGRLEAAMRFMALHAPTATFKEQWGG